MNNRKPAIWTLGLGCALIASGTAASEPDTDPVSTHAELTYRAQMRELAIDAALSELNGWPLLIEAGRLAEQIENEMQDELDAAWGWDDESGHPYVTYSLVYSHDPVWDDAAVYEAERKAARTIVQRARERGVFDMLAEATEMPVLLATPVEDDMMCPTVGELSGLRTLVMARCASIYLAVEAGDGEEAIRSIGQLLRVSDAIARHPEPLARTVALATYRMTLRRIRQSLMHYEWSADAGRGLLDQLNEVELPPLSFHLQGAQVAATWAVDDLFERAEQENRPVEDVARQHLDLMTRFGVFFGDEDAVETTDQTEHKDDLKLVSRAEMMAKIEAFCSEWSSRINRPRYEIAALARDETHLGRELGTAYFILPTILGVFPALIDETAMVQVDLDGTRLMLALELHQAAHGAYPTELSALPSEFSSEVPLNAFTGLPFVYQRVTDDPHGREYLLYSVGRDGIDNGGTVDPEGSPSSAWSKTYGEGFDYVINYLEPELIGEPDS